MRWNEIAATIDTKEALRLAASYVEGKKVFTTSFSPEDQIITHLLVRLNLDVQMVTLDTGRHFEQTYALHERTEKWLGIKINAFFPDAKDIDTLYAAQGVNGFYESIANRHECCRIRKTVPLEAALSGAKLWITGLRADQSAFRKSMNMWEEDKARGLTKYNPLFHWSDEKVQEYIQRHQVPISELHAQGYASIGCAPCTRAITAGEHPRAGRWWWENSKKECGLHLSNK